jgi:hypothetical protein
MTVNNKIESSENIFCDDNHIDLFNKNEGLCDFILVIMNEKETEKHTIYLNKIFLVKCEYFNNIIYPSPFWKGSITYEEGILKYPTHILNEFIKIDNVTNFFKILYCNNINTINTLLRHCILQMHHLSLYFNYKKLTEYIENVVIPTILDYNNFNYILDYAFRCNYVNLQHICKKLIVNELMLITNKDDISKVISNKIEYDKDSDDDMDDDDNVNNQGDVEDESSNNERIYHNLKKLPFEIIQDILLSNELHICVNQRKQILYFWVITNSKILKNSHIDETTKLHVKSEIMALNKKINQKYKRKYKEYKYTKLQNNNNYNSNSRSKNDIFLFKNQIIMECHKIDQIVHNILKLQPNHSSNDDTMKRCILITESFDIIDINNKSNNITPIEFNIYNLFKYTSILRSDEKRIYYINNAGHNDFDIPVILYLQYEVNNMDNTINFHCHLDLKESRHKTTIITCDIIVDMSITVFYENDQDEVFNFNNITLKYNKPKERLPYSIALKNKKSIMTIENNYSIQVNCYVKSIHTISYSS